MELRYYQSELIELTKEAFGKKIRVVLLVAPTGSGKTAMSSYILQGASQKGKQSYFCVHRRQLIEQVSRELAKQFIPHGFVASGYEVSDHYVSVTMQQTYVRRKGMRKAKLIVIDEAHLNCDTYKKIMDDNPNAYVLLLSATPERLDGKAIPADIKIETVDTAQLIAQGHLCNFKYYAPTKLDFTKLHSLGGDYVQSEVAEIAEKAKIIGRAIDHYRKYGENGKFINFSYSIEHSKETAAAFTEAGFPCVHLDCESSDEQRDNAFKKLVTGELRGISNVQLFAEGADCPALQVMIGQSPTKSMMRYRQRIGRVLRPFEGKDYAIILDMTNDYKTHGWPDDPHEWNWQGRDIKKRPVEKIVALCTCTNCYAVFRPRHVNCPECGKAREVDSRVVEAEEGELTELQRSQASFKKKMDKWNAIKNARTPQDLIDWAAKNGHNPNYGWWLWKLKLKNK